MRVMGAYWSKPNRRGKRKKIRKSFKSMKAFKRAKAGLKSVGVMLVKTGTSSY